MSARRISSAGASELVGQVYGSGPGLCCGSSGSVLVLVRSVSCRSTCARGGASSLLPILTAGAPQVPPPRWRRTNQSAASPRRTDGCREPTVTDGSTVSIQKPSGCMRGGGGCFVFVLFLFFVAEIVFSCVTRRPVCGCVAREAFYVTFNRKRRRVT